MLCIPVLLLTSALSGCGGGSNDLGADAADTEQGVIQGSVEDHYVAFKGIPYAAPPVGDLRFEPPQPPAHRDYRLDATSFGSNCVQPNSTFGSAENAEDCLYLNVYTPDTDGNYPVMVWIHGGAFETGSGDSYDPARLVEQGVVVVTINYRLGILGFLADPALSADSPNNASGDYGIMDQQAALRWVQANIGNFGGDKDNVTIFGESAGGHSVLTHLVSPASEGLFDKVIVESGSYQPGQRTLTTAEQTWGPGLVTKLGCDGAADVLACLRGVSVDKVRQVQSNNDISFLPNTRPDILPKTIQQALAAGDFTKVPVMMGTNRDEWQLFVALDELSNGDLPNTDAAYRSAIEALTGIPASSTTMDSLVAAYPWNSATYNNDVSLALSALGTDAVFACNGLAQAQSTSNGGVDTYAYEFADRNAPSIIGDSYSFTLGAAHAFEIQYVFNSEAALSARGMNQNQVDLANTMVGYWTRFAKTGDPNASGGSVTSWPKFSTSQEYMRLKTPSVQVISDQTFSGTHKCSIWNGS